jgi:hypothetical protein
VVIELWAVEAFCLTPVIACLFFGAGVVYVGDASVSGFGFFCYVDFDGFNLNLLLDSHATEVC